MSPESEKARSGKFFTAVPNPNQNMIGSFAGFNFCYRKIVLQIEYILRINRPHSGPETMTRRVDLVNILPALHCQNGYINILFCIAVLTYGTGGKKAFGIGIRQQAPSPEISALPGKFRNETSSLKIQFSGVQQQKTACQNRRYKTECAASYPCPGTPVVPNPYQT